MSLNLNKLNLRMSEAKEIYVIPVDVEAASVGNITKMLAGIEFFPDGTFVAKDTEGRFYPSKYYIAEEKDFGYFGDFTQSRTCWTTRKTLYERIKEAYIDTMNERISKSIAIPKPRKIGQQKAAQNDFDDEENMC